MNDLRYTYEPTMTWANFSESHKSAVFRDKHHRLIYAFTDYQLSVAKKKIAAGSSSTAFSSAVKASANALQKMSMFLAANPLAINIVGEVDELNLWKEVKSEDLIKFRDWLFEEIKSSGAGKSKFTVKQTVNAILRIVYKFYEWAQEDACIVNGIIGWTGCQIRSALIIRRASGNAKFSKDDLLYPACYRGVGGKSHFGGAKYWATDEDMLKLEEYFWENNTPEIAQRNILILKIVEYMGWRPSTVNSLTLEMFTQKVIEARKAQDVHHIIPPKQKFGRDYSFEMPYPVLDMICRYINGARLRMLDGRENRHLGKIFVSETNGAPLTDNTLTDIFTPAFQAIGAPKDSGLRSVRRKFCEDMFRAEIEFRKAEGFSLAYEDVAFAISQKMGHDSMISQEAYYRVLRRRKITNSLVEQQKDALATKDAELITVKARCAQLEAKNLFLEARLSKVSAGAVYSF